jgi:hypothetical protein
MTWSIGNILQVGCFWTNLGFRFSPIFAGPLADIFDIPSRPLLKFVRYHFGRLLAWCWAAVR